jgi:hypothetical protein
VSSGLRAATDVQSGATWDAAAEWPNCAPSHAAAFRSGARCMVMTWLHHAGCARAIHHDSHHPVCRSRECQARAPGSRRRRRVSTSRLAAFTSGETELDPTAEQQAAGVGGGGAPHHNRGRGGWGGGPKPPPPPTPGFSVSCTIARFCSPPSEAGSTAGPFFEASSNSCRVQLAAPLICALGIPMKQGTLVHFVAL